MEQSILKSIKKMLGIADDDDSFDLDVITHINSAFSTLQQVGIGPEIGFAIEDDSAVWSDFLPEAAPPQLNATKTCIYLKVRLLFDPPTTIYLLTSMEKQLEEGLWRLNVMREESDWVDPDPGFLIVDGGDPVGPHFVDG